MTKREAAQILIAAAADHCRGAGTGIGVRPDDTQKRRIREAIKKLWRMAYDFDFSGNDVLNLGLLPEEPTR